MNLLHPINLLWAGLALPIVIFYILKVRVRRVPVSTVMFWNQIFEQKEARSLWQKLRHLLSLLLQLLFLMLLVLALTEPFFAWQAREACRVVLVLDNSASMRASDVQTTRLEQARRQARNAISSLKPQDTMAIIAAGTQPRVVCGMTSHQRTLRNALDAVPATDGPTKVRESIELARQLIVQQKNGRIEIFTDGCFADAAKVTRDHQVVWHVVGQKTGNVGITQFQVRRSLIDPIGYQILAEVRNFSDEPVELRFEIDLDEEIVDVVPIRLEPGGAWSHVFEKISADGGHVTASLDRSDALLADNVAYAILPQRKRQHVTLVTEGQLFLEKVFEAHRLVDLNVTSKSSTAVGKDAIVVFHRNVPNPVPPGRVIVIDPTNATDLWQLGEALENPIVGKQDTESELMANIRLDNVLMPEARQLTLQGHAHVLAQTASDAPLYFWIQRPSGNVLVLTVNLDRGDLPLRTAFPILMSNALAWFQGEKGELRESLKTGDVQQIQLDQLVAAARTSIEDTSKAASEPHTPVNQSFFLESPDQRQFPLAGPESGASRFHSRSATHEDLSSDLLKGNPEARDPFASVSVGPLDRCGIWRVVRRTSEEPDHSAEQEIDRLACNLANQEESDIRVSIESTVAASPLVAGWAARPLWFYLTGLAWCLIVVEWYLYQRRKIS